MRNGCNIQLDYHGGICKYACDSAKNCDLSTNKSECEYRSVDEDCCSPVARSAALSECVTVCSRELFEMNRKIGRV